MGELERRFTSPEAVDYLRKSIAKHVKELGRTHGAELREHEARLARTEQRIAALVAFISDGEDSDHVRVSLRDLEVQAQQEKAAIEALRASAEKPIVLPSPDEVLRTGRRLSELLQGDAMKAQGALRRLFGGKPITMKPQPDRTYIAEGEYFPMLALTEGFPDKRITPRSERTGARHTGSCASVGPGRTVSRARIRDWCQAGRLPAQSRGLQSR